MSAKAAPPLNAPASDVTVKISAIDSTLGLIGARCDQMWTPSIKGFDRLNGGCWTFLIEHPSGRKLLYDLGCRKDWQNLPPAIGLQKFLDMGVVKELVVEKNVAEILTEGVDLRDIEGIIWSHWYSHEP